MHIYFLLIIFCEGLAHYEPDSKSPNVGTVLFTHSDIHFKTWTRPRISLLLVRQHFQKLIPPAQLTGTINEYYVTNLLNYFHKSYSTVKREMSPAMHNIMNIALSDAIGGYLKLWVLPITKYAYYGGTVSLDNAANIFQVYDDIKATLKTDGRGWRSPNRNLLNAVVINIAPPTHLFFTRSMRQPCEHLTYMEKTEEGLGVPLPIIIWNASPTLVLPIKNQSLVSLTSRNSSKALLKYYDIANRCIQSQDPNRLEVFNDRFQNWLSSDVEPHLNDDSLYVAFGGVLVLMNKTKSFCNRVNEMFDDNISKLKEKFSLPTCWTFKVVILFTVLALELVWCIGTLICMMRSKRKKYRQCLNFRRMFSRKYDIFHTNLTKDDGSIQSSKQDRSSRSIKLFVKPRTKNLEVDAHFSPCDNMMKNSSSSQCQNRTSSDRTTLRNEIPRKSSLKKILPEFDSNFMNLQNKEFPSNKLNNMCHVTSINEIKERTISSKEVLESKKMTLINESDQTIKQVIYSEESFTSKPSVMTTKCVRKCCLISGNRNDHLGTPTCVGSTIANVDKNEQKHDPKKVTYTESPASHGRWRRREKTQLKAKKNSDVVSRSQIQEHVVESRNKKINSNNPKEEPHQPLLRIKIDRPKAVLQVGITSFRKCAIDAQKPSKIPRLASKDTKTDNHKQDTEAGGTSSELKSPKNTKGNLNKDAQKEIRSQDDSAIDHPNTNRKLNMTL